MNILINASNSKKGGGVQVADSICRELHKYTDHNFVIVHTNVLKTCAIDVQKMPNIKTIEYDLPISFWIFLSGRCRYLDEIVKQYNIDAVVTVFGPSYWIPKVKHLSGFARPHVVLYDSPFWKTGSILSRIKNKIKRVQLKFFINRCSNYYYTENEFISQRLRELFPNKFIYTVTNNAHQVFRSAELRDDSVKLPDFDGVTLLTISANYPHKNLGIIKPVISYLTKRHPSLRYRFAVTLDKDVFPFLDEESMQHVVFIGPVSIQQCPNLYEQCDAMFLPTLLECFSASYAEAMIMHKPILTSDLGFARSVCGDSALYFDPMSPESIGEVIYSLATNHSLIEQSLANQGNQLKKLDSAEDRARKIVSIVESI